MPRGSGPPGGRGSRTRHIICRCGGGLALDPDAADLLRPHPVDRRRHRVVAIRQIRDRNVELVQSHTREARERHADLHSIDLNLYIVRQRRGGLHFLAGGRIRRGGTEAGPKQQDFVAGLSGNGGTVNGSETPLGPVTTTCTVPLVESAGTCTLSCLGLM